MAWIYRAHKMIILLRSFMFIIKSKCSLFDVCFWNHVYNSNIGVLIIATPELGTSILSFVKLGH